MKSESYSVSILSTFKLHWNSNTLWNSVIRNRLHYIILSYLSKYNLISEKWVLKTLHSKVPDSAFKSLNQTSTLEEFSAICQCFWLEIINSTQLPTFFWNSRNTNKLGSYPNWKQKVEVRPFNNTQDFFSNWDNKTWSSPRINTRVPYVS
jgi:hypothetical protein